MNYKLSDVAVYISVKIQTDNISIDEYVSTENMLPDKGGITRASTLPSTPRTNSFKSRDVLFSNIRTYFRKVWFAKFDGGVSNDVLVIRSLDQDILFDKYLYYLLSSEEFIQYTVKTAKGTKMPRGDKLAIMSYEFNLPSLTIQKKIAHILSILDDKIEKNPKMNQTLEEMIQILFRSWFVDFDQVSLKATCTSEQELESAAIKLGISTEILSLFPGKFEESEIGMIPLGWNNIPFSKVAKLDTSSVKPFTFPGTTWKHFSIPAFDSKRHPAYELGSEIKSNKYKVDNNAILSSKLNPHTPRTWIPNVKEGDSAICSTEFMQFIPLDKAQRSYVYSLITSKYFQDEIKTRVTGTTGSRQRAQPKEVAEIGVCNPSKEIIKAFTNIIDSLIKRQLENIEEIQILQQTRDTLLPQLLSNELNVDEIEMSNL